MRHCHHSPPDPECLACNAEEDAAVAERERNPWPDLERDWMDELCDREASR